MMTLAQALQLLGGQATLVGDGNTPVTRVHSDTRTLQPGDLFVALKGERFDAHDFLPQARAAGAAAALAERGIADAGLPGLQVADSLQALQQLAAAWRRSVPVSLIAVTGSNGKTTVTQMVAAILRAWLGDAAFATQGNFNNQFGVPLTLLRLRATPALAHRVGVVELGTNHPGEIALLAQLTLPQVALINNAQREHQEFLHGLDAVARENGSVIDALGPDGTVVVPAADACTPIWRAMAGTRPVLGFALDAAADVRGRASWQGDRWAVSIGAPQGTIDTTVAIAGRHNALNAVAAAACALAAGAPPEAVARGLAAFRPVVGRSRTLALHRGGRDLTLVDDSYNANPDSVLAAIDVLADLPGPRWLILADMAEVGAQGPQFHDEVGRHAAARGLEHVWTVGRISAATSAACGGRHFDDMAVLLAALPAGPAAASVLVKGSRSMRTERVVQAFTGHAEDAHAA
ncbi:MAG: UDP-N-acetylmuramoyl-tripeptide--D-alanyl-D-alanine ligase [Rubrivivax sp.]